MATSLRDVQFSMNGEQAQENNVEPGNQLPGIVKYNGAEKGASTDKKWVIFKLKDNTKQGGVYIPNTDDVFNPVSKTVERVRLLAGVPSIWMKDQKDLTPDYIRQNQRSLSFPRGHKMLRIESHDKTGLEFLRICNSNIGNTARIRGTRFEFYEYDFEAAEKESFEKEERELEAAISAKGTNLEEMKKHASFLGIRMTNDLGEPKTEEGIRREYVIRAKRDPDFFIKTKGTPQVEISWLIKKGIADSKIEVNKEPGKIYWAKDGGYIGSYPFQTMTPEQYLFDLANMPTEEGIRFKNDLQRIAT